MNAIYGKLLGLVLDRSVKSAQADFAGTSEIQRRKLEAWTTACSDCRNMSPTELGVILKSACEYVNKTQIQHASGTIKYRELGAARARMDAIKWACGCVSAFLVVNGEAPICKEILPEEAIEVLFIMQHQICGEKSHE